MIKINSDWLLIQSVFFCYDVRYICNFVRVLVFFITLGLLLLVDFELAVAFDSILGSGQLSVCITVANA